MQYIQTKSNEYVLHLSSGLVHLTSSSFNFQKIIRRLKENCREEDIVELLVPPVLTDGCYYAYEYPEHHMMKYVHVGNTGCVSINNLIPTSNGGDDIPIDEDKLVGVYASLEELMEDWPEYVL